MKIHAWVLIGHSGQCGTLALETPSRRMTPGRCRRWLARALSRARGEVGEAKAWAKRTNARGMEACFVRLPDQLDPPDRPTPGWIDRGERLTRMRVSEGRWRPKMKRICRRGRRKLGALACPRTRKAWVRWSKRQRAQKPEAAR